MSNWTMTYLLNDTIVTQIIYALDLNSASILAIQSIPDGAIFQSVELILDVDSILAAGIAKLVSLGLTEAEATAVASSDN